MPGDSLLLNTKSVSQNTYDAIVVGSGISGGWAAKELSEKGLKTLVLERGHNVVHIKDYGDTPKDPWQLPHRMVMTIQTGKTAPYKASVMPMTRSRRIFSSMTKRILIHRSSPLTGYAVIMSEVAP